MANFLSSQTHLLYRYVATSIVTCTLAVYANAEAVHVSTEKKEWDWHPKESLTTSQKSSLNQYCRGAYLDQWQGAKQKNSIQLFADSAQHRTDGSTTLRGAAEVRSHAFSLNADEIKSTSQQNYSAKGNILLRQDGQLMTGDSITIANSNGAVIKHAKFVFHPERIRGEASSISSKTGVIFIEEGFYTTCEPGSGSWQLYGSSIELNSDTGFGTAKHVQIRIDGVPIFYFPWLRFPINQQRHSGFLFPDFRYSSSDGISLSSPYYLNLAPQYDATITPHLVEKLGEGVDVEIRHLSPYGTTLFEQSSFSHNDEGLQTTRKLSSAQQFTDSFATGFLLEDNPTEDLYPERNTTSLGEKDHYERSVYAQYNKGQFSSNITNKRFQTPDASEDEPLEWLPRLTADYNYYNDWLSYQPSFQYTDFFDPDKTEDDGVRLVTNQELIIHLDNQWGYVRPGVLSQSRRYDLNSNSNSDFSINHTSTFFDSGFIFDRHIQVDNANWRQTLEPKFSYLNAPFISQNDIPNFDTSKQDVSYSQAFSHTRFNGNDRIGDTEQYTIGIESRFYDSNNIERWALKFGQIFYLQNRRISVEGNDDTELESAEKSALLSSISYNHNELINAALDLNYNTEKDLLELGRFSTLYAQKNGLRMTANYLYKIDQNSFEVDTKQSQIGTIIPLSDNWHFFYQQDYDWIEETDTKNVTGFGFENCCIKASASHQRWRDSDNEQQEGFFLRFILRSLSTAGSKNSIKSVENDYWNEGNIGYN